MNQKYVKTVGIMLCLLVLGTLIPAVGAIKQKDTQSEPSTMFSLAMVMGRVTIVHKIGRIIFAHANRLYYMGIGTNRDIDMGIIRGREIMFRDTPRFHMFSIDIDTVVFGRVSRLRVLL